MAKTKAPKTEGPKKLTVEVNGTYWAKEFPEERGLEIKEGKTGRGFALAEFEDVYGQKCSLQNSSLASEAAIWFGVENTGAMQGPSGKTGEQVDARMHLTRKQVEQLLPYFHQFVETGHIEFEE